MDVRTLSGKGYSHLPAFVNETLALSALKSTYAWHESRADSLPLPSNYASFQHHRNTAGKAYNNVLAEVGEDPQ